jgi:hypothetical protein
LPDGPLIHRPLIHRPLIHRPLIYGPLIPGALIHGPLIHGPPIYGPPICGPPVCGTVPPVRTRVPASLPTVVATGVPPGITAGVGGGIAVVEVGVTGDDGPTPARVPGGLQTAVAHAPLTTPGGNSPACRRYLPEITPSWSTSAGPATWSVRPVPPVTLSERYCPARTSYGDRPSVGAAGA